MKIAKRLKPRLFSPLWLIVGIAAIIVACGSDSAAPVAPAATTAPAAKAPAAQAPAAQVPAATAVPKAKAVPTKAPAATKVVRQPIVRIANPPPDVESNRTWVGPWLYIFQHDVFAETLLGNDDRTGEAFGLLAESWETNSDFTQWSFKLKEGIPFQHGWGEVTTKDLEHTFNQLVRDDSLASLRAVWDTTSVEIIDDYNVNFNFGLPYLDGTKLFSRHAGDLIIVSDAQYQAEGLDAFDNNRTAGTGPYQMTDRKLGVSLSYERVPEGHHMFDVDFDNFEFVWAQEPLTRMAMLLSGEVQISSVERTLQPDVEARGMEIISSTLPSVQVSLMFGGLYFQNSEKFPDHYQPGLPLEKKNVRHALNVAIDRDLILEEIYLGRATPVYRFAFNPLNEGWNPDWVDNFEDAYGYDPDLARELLAKEGYTADNPLKIRAITTVIPGSPELHDVTEAVQIMFAEVGIDMSMTKIDFGEWLAQLRAHEWHNAVVATRNTPIRTTQLGIHTFFADTGNWWGFADETTLEGNVCLFTQADINIRHECALKLGNHLFDNYTDLPMFELSHDMAVNPEFIESWVYPGLSSAGITHFHNIKAVK